MDIRYNAEVRNVRAVCADVYSISLAGEFRRPLPGQFMHVFTGGDRILRRPISVCDCDGDILKLVFELKGEGTLWLSRRRPDDTLDLMGPLGQGFDLSGRVILVGGGLGVAPLLLAARTAPERSAILGFRSADRLMLLDEFSAVCDTHICSDDGTAGERSTVDVPLRRALEAGGFDRVLACGPRPMLRAVAGVCADLEVPCQVSLEERMACGIGACLGCACKTAHGVVRVCRDGPVFDASEVIWDA